MGAEGEANVSLQAEDNPGFLDALLNVLDAEQDNAVRLSSKKIVTCYVSKFGSLG